MAVAYVDLCWLKQRFSKKENGLLQWRKLTASCADLNIDPQGKLDRSDIIDMHATVMPKKASNTSVE